MVMKLVLICALVVGISAAASSQPRLEAVTAGFGTPRQLSVFMRDIFTDEVTLDPVSGQPARIWGLPKEPPGGIPFSATVLYLFWSLNNGAVGGGAGIDTATGTNSVVDDIVGNTFTFDPTAFNTLTFSFDVQLPAGSHIAMKWESGNLEYDPFNGCSGSGPSGDCRCNLADTDRVHQYMTTASMMTTDTGSNLWVYNAPGGPVNTPAAGTFTVNLAGVLPTYFDHAPFAGQNPFLRTYRRLCLQWTVPGGITGPPLGGPGPLRWFDTNVMIAVTQPCIDPAVIDGTVTTDVVTPQIPLPPADYPNFQCTQKSLIFTYAVGAPGGAPLLASAPNQQPGFLGAYFEPFFQNAGITDEQIETADTGFAFGETLAMINDRLSRTVCCGFSGNVGTSQWGDAIVYAPGVCIDITNSKAHCCGRRPYNPLAEQCCQKPSSTVRYLDQPCPCFSAAWTTQSVTPAPSLISPCVFNGANQADLSGNTDRTAGLNDNLGSPLATCCNATKWGTAANLYTTGSPFSNGGTGDQIDFNPSFGVLGFNPTVGVNSFCVGQNGDTRWQCCDDGNVYDVGTSQCCPINGVQSLNNPCPCGADLDCPNSPNTPLQLCCMQTFPTPFALPHITAQVQPLTCSKFANWPRSQQQLGSFEDFLSNQPVAGELQRCPGSCYSSQFQICCNGRTCLQNFERCCNDTCCNHFTESCMIGRRPGSWGNRWNPREWSVYYETCSSLEYLNGRKAFFVFVLPSILLFATMLSLAFVTILARRATEHIFELTERAMVFCAVFAVFLSCTYYFSPIYKNGVAIAFVSLGAILIAVARKRSASLFLVIVLIFLILYVIDPFSGNIYLSLTSNMPVRGAPKSSSLLEAALNMWVHNDRCTYYYQWFVQDNTLRDFERFDNPAQLTWGFCSRAWVTALMIFALMLYVLLLLLLLLAIFSLVKKLGIKDVEPIELEIAYDDAPAPFAPGAPPVYFTG